MHRPAAAAAVTLVAVLAAGCAQPRPLVRWGDDTEGETNAWTVRTVNDHQRDAAVIAQRTLFDHHFTPGSAALNERGERDLAILTAGLATADALDITVTRGDADATLFERRIALVRARFEGAGIRADRLAINGGFAGGGATPGARAAADYARPSEPDPHNLHKGPDTK